MSYGADAAAADDDYNKNNKLFEKEHKEVIRKYGTINLILYQLK
jgi:hypothetical protein